MGQEHSTKLWKVPGLFCAYTALYFHVTVQMTYIRTIVPGEKSILGLLCTVHMMQHGHPNELSSFFYMCTAEVSVFLFFIDQNRIETGLKPTHIYKINVLFHSAL